ncbi:MAG: OmpA family protein [bacterium]
MRERTIVTIGLILTLVAFGLSQAAVTLNGQRGLLRVHSARGSDQGLLTVNLHNEGRYETDMPVSINPNGMGKAYYLTTHLGLTYGITDFLELSAATLLLGDLGRQTTPRKQYETSEGFGDTQLGFKLSYPGELSEYLHLGLQGFVVLPTGRSGKGVVGVRQDLFSRDETYGGGRVLVDFNFGQIGWHLNGGFLAVGEPETLFANAFYPQSDQFLFGTGVEYAAGPILTLFAEVTGEYTDTDLLEKKTALRFTPGVRLFGQNTPVDVGVDLRLSPEESREPDWNLIVGFSIGSMLRPTVGVLLVSVVDAETGEPMAATVTFPGTTVQTVTTDAVSGSFDIELEEGEYTVLVSNPDYFSQTREAVAVRAGKRIQLDFTLEARPRVGKITGMVVNSRTNEPIEATISFPQTPVESVKTRPATGMFEVTLPEGTVLVKVESEGYLSLSEPVVVKRDLTEVKNFSLQPQVVPMGKVTGKVADVATDSVLSALITFLDTQIQPVKTKEHGIYEAEVAPGTYRVEAAAEGYVSKVEPVVVEDGKTVLQNFALRRIPKKGEVIHLRGITFEFNKSTIRPDSYPILDEAAQTLKEIPELKVQIEGHTDSIGSDEYNQKLSEARANAVRNYLIARHQIDPSRLVAVGFGEKRPVADNSTEEGRQLNRRIDFVVLATRD